ncbi:MAG: peptidoglycan-binding domain-containing protein [Pseudomonadota bacterium]
MKTFLLTTASAVLGTYMMSSSAAFSQELPPANAAAGTCWAKVLLPARYENIPEEVMVQPASSSFRKTPAVYREVAKEVLVQEESYELIPVPPVYETVTETVLVQPEQVVKTIIPATFKTETKRVKISDARVEWKVGRGAYEKIDEATGEIMCRVEIPAVFKTVEQQVIDQASQTKEEVIPAQYATVERRVMRTPPTTKKKVIPAKFRTITIKELVEPEQFEVVQSPARFATIQKRNLVQAEAVKWREILCETNTTPAVVKRIQNALIAAGYNLGFEPDGKLGEGTQAIIRRFQEDNQLPTGGLTISTIERLGIRL